MCITTGARSTSPKMFSFNTNALKIYVIRFIIYLGNFIKKTLRFWVTKNRDVSQTSFVTFGTNGMYSEGTPSW
jgi:hypothetical protein